MFGDLLVLVWCLLSCWCLCGVWRVAGVGAVFAELLVVGAVFGEPLVMVRCLRLIRRRSRVKTVKVARLGLCSCLVPLLEKVKSHGPYRPLSVRVYAPDGTGRSTLAPLHMAETHTPWHHYTWQRRTHPGTNTDTHTWAPSHLTDTHTCKHCLLALLAGSNESGKIN